MEYFEVITNAQTGEITTRPLTDAEIEALNQPLTHAKQEAARQAAYAAEADPIAMQMLRDEATKEEWLAKIDEIKARYPYPQA